MTSAIHTKAHHTPVLLASDVWMKISEMLDASMQCRQENAAMDHRVFAAVMQCTLLNISKYITCNNAFINKNGMSVAHQ